MLAIGSGVTLDMNRLVKKALLFCAPAARAGTRIECALSPGRLCRPREDLRVPLYPALRLDPGGQPPASEFAAHGVDCGMRIRLELPVAAAGEAAFVKTRAS